MVEFFQLLAPSLNIPACFRLPIASIQSIYIMEGAAYFAFANNSFTLFGPTPTQISQNSEALQEKNGTPASPAVALARVVLPVPEGPKKMMPFLILAPICWYFAGCCMYSMISLRDCLQSSSPMISSKVRVFCGLELVLRSYLRLLMSKQKVKPTTAQISMMASALPADVPLVRQLKATLLFLSYAYRAACACLGNTAWKMFCCRSVQLIELARILTVLIWLLLSLLQKEDIFSRMIFASAADAAPRKSSNFLQRRTMAIAREACAIRDNLSVVLRRGCANLASSLVSHFMIRMIVA